MQTKSTEAAANCLLFDVMRFSRINAYCSEHSHACLTGESSGYRGYATELTAGMTLLNKGIKAGPGGRSSVSLSAHA